MSGSSRFTKGWKRILRIGVSTRPLHVYDYPEVEINTMSNPLSTVERIRQGLSYEDRLPDEFLKETTESRRGRNEGGFGDSDPYSHARPMVYDISATGKPLPRFAASEEFPPQQAAYCSRCQKQVKATESYINKDGERICGVDPHEIKSQSDYMRDERIRTKCKPMLTSED